MTLAVGNGKRTVPSVAKSTFALAFLLSDYTIWLTPPALLPPDKVSPYIDII